jgi:hypothetical protein
MHTSGGAACGRDDDGAPELGVSHSLRNTKVKETRSHVNESILRSAQTVLGRIRISNPLHLNFPFDPGFHGPMMTSLPHPLKTVGLTMKKWMFIILAVAFLMPITTLSQHSSKAAEAKPAISRATIVARKAVSISGQISMDGRTLVSEENDIWSVTNPKVLAGHEGQQVSVKCQVFPDKNEIHVFSLKVPLMEVKSATNKADSAFRR